MKDFEISRRKLLKVLGGGILVAALAPDPFALVAQRGAQVPQVVSAWIHIATDGRITVYTGKVDVGQNSRTSVTQAAAEELRVPIDRVTVVMGDTDLVPFDMGTFGSGTTPRMIPQIRRAASAARRALIGLAAKKWSADPAGLKAENGMVSGSGHQASYGEIAQSQPIAEAIEQDEPLTPAAEWKVLGKSVPKIDGKSFVTGQHKYASDMSRPGMLHAKVLRRPAMGAKLKSADTQASEAMPGVRIVKETDLIAAAAPTTRLATKALAQIKAEWETSPQPSSKDVHKLMRGDAEPEPPPHGWGDGKVYRQTYTCPYIAHVPLEPRAALAEWDGKKMTVWTGSQRPFGVKPEVAQALGIPESQVRVIVPDTGGGYGGKHTGDAAVEAARMAKALGVPVKIVWTREEEFTFAYFRPGGVVEAASSTGPDGLLTGWTFDNYNSGGSAIETPYEVANKRIQYHEYDSPVRQGSYRGLAATFNTFARETHMDELAIAQHADPLEFRLKNLKDERLKKVLTTAAEKFGWGKDHPKEGHGYGIACGVEKGGHIATVAEVSVGADREIKVLRLAAAFDCGAALNPDLLLNQVVGAHIMGMGGALYEAIEFENGKILTNHLRNYRVPRYSDVPVIDAVIVDNRDLPSAGAGESPIMGVCPAIGNAVFQATGTRLRHMPLNLEADQVV